MKQSHLMTAAILALGLAAPALASAQTTSGISGYGTLGVTADQTNGADTSAVQGRLGARFGRYFGVEGELAAGMTGDKTTVAGTEIKTSLRNEKALYGVGFLPLNDKIDLLARVGYGDSELRTKTGPAASVADLKSVNYGVGAQYAFDDHNGLRADFTREDYRHTGGDTNSWGLSYVRKF